jgi:hypothetical protein
MRNTADVTGDKPIAVLLQPISGVSAINPLGAFYTHGGKRDVLFFYFVLDTTRDYNRTVKSSHDSMPAAIEMQSNCTGLQFYCSRVNRIQTAYELQFAVRLQLKCSPSVQILVYLFFFIIR